MSVKPEEPAATDAGEVLLMAGVPEALPIWLAPNMNQVMKPTTAEALQRRGTMALRSTNCLRRFAHFVGTMACLVSMKRRKRITQKALIRGYFSPDTGPTASPLIPGMPYWTGVCWVLAPSFNVRINLFSEPLGLHTRAAWRRAESGATSPLFQLQLLEHADRWPCLGRSALKRDHCKVDCPLQRQCRFRERLEVGCAGGASHSRIKNLRRHMHEVLRNDTYPVPHPCWSTAGHRFGPAPRGSRRDPRTRPLAGAPRSRSGLVVRLDRPGE
jgi:hypothetical protein